MNENGYEEKILNPETVTKSEKDMGLLFYISIFIVGFWGPLVIWLMKKDESEFINEIGREYFNFFITRLIYGTVAGILCIILIGIPFIVALAIASLVLTILALIAASKGEVYRFPKFLALKFLK